MGAPRLTHTIGLLVLMRSIITSGTKRLCRTLSAQCEFRETLYQTTQTAKALDIHRKASTIPGQIYTDNHYHYF